MKELDNKIKEVPVYLDSYTFVPTDDPHLFRVVDREGNWTHYFQDEIKQYLPASNHIINLGFPKGEGLIQWLKKTSLEEAEKRLNSAAEQGANVHSVIRALILGVRVEFLQPFHSDRGEIITLTDDEWNCVMTWVEWAKVFKPRVLVHEASMWNRKYLYAGTPDWIGMIDLPEGCNLYIDDRLVTIKEAKRISVGPLDWKTGGTYDDHKLQTASYAGFLTTKPKGEFYTGVVRLGTKHNAGYEMRLWSREKTKEHFRQFLDARSQFYFVTGRKEWQPEIKKIPLSLEIKIPRITTRKRKEK